MGKTIVVANQKGGAGKTTTALNLASCIGRRERKVIFIDFDQQGNSTGSIGIETSHTIFGVMKGDCTLPEAIQHTKYFDAISADSELSNISESFSLDKDVDNIYKLTDICEALNQLYDYVIIDTHPDRNLALTMAYAAADYVIVPSDSSKYSLDGIVEIINDINSLKKGRNSYSHAEILGFILTRCRTANVAKVATKSLESIAQSLDNKVFVDRVRISSKAEESTYTVGTLQDYDRNGSAAQDYRRIADTVMEMIEGE